MFETYQLNGLEWQQVVTETTNSGKYRVEITWALAKYRVSVVEVKREVVVRRCHPLYAHTAVATANRLFNQFNRRG